LLFTHYVTSTENKIITIAALKTKKTSSIHYKTEVTPVLKSIK